MKIKRWLVQVIETEKIVRCLLYMVTITVILDTITTLYALGIGLNEGNIIAYSFMQYFGTYSGLIILSTGKIIFFILAYLFVKKESSKLLINNRKNLAYLYDGVLFLILLIIFINTSLTVINNSSQICQKINNW